MKKLLTLTLVAVVAATGFAQTQKEFVAHLVKMETAATKAFEKMDLKWFENASSTDFTYTAHDGTKSNRRPRWRACLRCSAWPPSSRCFRSVATCP